MGILETLRKKFEKENAEKFIKINIEMSGNANEILKLINKNITNTKKPKQKAGAKK